MEEKKPTSTISCKKCGKSHMGIIRSKKITEYRVLQDELNLGTMVFKGNWKTEQTSSKSKPQLKCLACETIIKSGDDLNGCGGFKFNKKEEVLFYTDFWDKLNS